MNLRLKALGSTIGRRLLIADQPIYDYLAQRHDWDLVHLNLDPRAELDSAGRQELQRTIQDSNSPICLWKTAPRSALRDQLERDYGIPSVVYSPVEALRDTDRQRGRDWLSLQRDNLSRLERAVLR